MTDETEQFTFQLSKWVKDPEDLDFMKRQLGDIPSKIRRHTANGKYALFRLQYSTAIDTKKLIDEGIIWVK
jgi:hypothetical protein